MLSSSDPMFYARLGGLLYLYIIFAGIFTQVFVRGRLTAPREPALTAENILKAEPTFRKAFIGELLAFLCDVALSAIFYVLLRPAQRSPCGRQMLAGVHNRRRLLRSGP